MALFDRIRDSRFLAYDALQRANHDYESVFLRSQKDISQLLEQPSAESSILVLGCGYNYPEVILFSDIFKDVVGLDTRAAFFASGIIRTLIEMKKRKGSIRKALWTTVLRRYQYRRYYRHLTGISGARIQHKQYKFTACVSKHFDVTALYQVDEKHRKMGTDNGFQYEHEELLSERIREELGAYPLDLLLTRSYLIIGRK